MFEAFSPPAQRVIVYAVDESRALGQDYIGTEHLLLGLVREADGVAAQALTSLGVSVEALRDGVEEIIGHGRREVPRRTALTPRSKDVLELALRERARSRADLVVPEHILLALIGEGEGIAAQVLHRLGAGEARIRGAVDRLTPQGAKPAPMESPIDDLEALVEDPAEGSVVGANTSMLGAQLDPARRTRGHQTDPATWPLCASCGTSLSGAATLYRTVAVSGSEEEDMLKVTVVFCPFCGVTIGVFPR
jgi:ATP-dependent Clp protease ATP-binding subunit ClpA